MITVNPGERFGRWTILELTRTDPTPAVPYGRRAALCRCDCGAIRKVMLLNLPKSQSCGCYKREKVIADNKRLKSAQITRHGMSGSPTWSSWRAMRKRCEDPKQVGFKNYGGRGIKVCTRWQTFENFLADMGERPTGMWIDRINNDGNYEPGNCKWSTPTEQATNRSRPGERHTCASS